MAQKQVRENLGNAKMWPLQGPGTQLPQGFSIRPNGLERIFQAFLSNGKGLAAPGQHEVELGLTKRLAPM